jgi:putative endonuclease
MATVYILHSKSADKFYIGFTSIQIEERFERHLNGYYQNKFTATYSDWILFCEIKCESNEQARKIEAHIKKMKSKVYINNLIKYPEIIEKLLQKFKDS